MRYLVALNDDSNEKCINKALMDVALRHAVAGRDSLLLARVVEELRPDPAVILLDLLCDDDEQIRTENEARKKLEVYANQCVAAGVDCGFMVLTDDHPGSALCKAATEHKADCMIVGRRDMGAFQRFLTFSTSKYCVDNSDCNVIVVKRPYSEEPSPVKEIEQEERDKRQLATESPRASPAFFTLRDPTEMKRAFERSRNPLTGQQPEIQQTDPKKRAALDAVFQEEESERASRLLNSDELAQERRERKANQDLARRLEEQERSERVHKWDSEIERRVRQRESKRNLEITKKLEEEERQRRIAMSSNVEERENLDKIIRLEEKERKARVKAWNKEQKEIEKERKEESKRNRELVAQLEEAERASRLVEERKLIEKEKAHRSMERSISLERVQLVEEEERMGRVRELYEEEVREQAMTEVRSKQDREIAKRLEAEEKERRIREDAELQREREQESKLDLQKVKQMEEEERVRRMKPMKIME